MSVSNEIYLGDGVYACLEDGMIKLVTDREGRKHYIYLDAVVFNALFQWARRDLIVDASTFTIAGRER